MVCVDIFQSTIVPEGFKGGTRGIPIMPRDVSLSDRKCWNGGYAWVNEVYLWVVYANVLHGILFVHVVRNGTNFFSLRSFVITCFCPSFYCCFVFFMLYPIVIFEKCQVHHFQFEHK